MALTLKQRGVLKGVVAGTIATVVVIVGAVLADPVSFSRDATSGERIAFALKADVLVALWLAISIGVLARHRFFTPEDIDGGGLSQGSEKAKVLQASLQNTLEQALLAVLAHSMWAVVMPASWLSAVPAAAILFLCGRVLFVRGYSGGAPSRALGFALTFYPSALMLFAVAIAALARWF